jgi:xanthine dehydrogenase accessory factor
VNDVQEQIDHWVAQGEEIALATVVGVRGSAPRPAGARFALTRSGSMVGSVSGGCVESDVYERALTVLDRGLPALVSYGPAKLDGFEVGLSCDGYIDVLIERFAPDEGNRLLQAATNAGRPAAMATCLAPEALLGAHLVVLGGDEGQDVGSIAPSVDAQIANEARLLLHKRAKGVIEIVEQAETYRVFIETFAPPQRLYIVGATHIAISLCKMAKEVGFQVYVIDPRTAFADRERFAAAHALLHEWPVDVLDGAALDADAYVLTLTHDTKFDLPTLARALRSDVRYIGALGSRKTHDGRLEALREEGFEDEALTRIKTPVGLDLGGRSPEEIALSILAEMVATRYQRSGGSLSAG